MIYKRILVGIDGSEESEKAFLEAVDVAKENEATLYLAWINTETNRNPNQDQFSSKEQLIYDRKVLKKELEAKEQGVEKVVPIVLSGDPKKYLSQSIPNEHKIDLIVLGATSKGLLTKLLIGSTAKYVVEHAQCSVLIAK
ncbi:universal stress protein [Vagococcus silagei]|uniref:Universal stress protein n=1 Tax=Vagococcus silagei TaxID=2508885 RepID=A0A4S3B8Y6_9ENTE|nr:universal stress protein [Vagococcus silagei]THB62396.1 universal stress protein [Vagococcus silagei]